MQVYCLILWLETIACRGQRKSLWHERLLPNTAAPFSRSHLHKNSLTFSVLFLLLYKGNNIALWFSPYMKLGQILHSIFKLCVCVCVWVGAKFVQSCPTLCNPMDRCPPCSSVHVILQTRIRSGLPYPSLGDLPNLGTEAATLMSPLLAGGFFTTSATSVAPLNCVIPVTFLMCFELQLLHLFSP